MKIIASLLSILLFTLKTYSQEIGVPYRVGNKFGISNEQGKMLVAPRFDIVEPHHNDGNPYFEAYTFKDSIVLSSLIFHNKIIISNQRYDDYYFDNDLFQAIAYEPGKNKTGSLEYFGEKCHLYDRDGKKVLDEDFVRVSIIDGLDPEDKLNEVLVYTFDMNKKYSLFVYNRKLKKIVKTFIDKTGYLEVTYNYENDYMDQSITYIYRDKTGKGRKIQVKAEGGQYKLAINEATDLENKDEENDRSGEYDAIMEMPEKPIPGNADHSSGGEISLNIRKVTIKGRFYYLPRKVEEIEIKNELLNKSEQYIVSKDGKKGLFNVSSNTFIIPIQYDEILNASFEGMNGGHIIRNGDKYGVFIYDYPNNMTIAPVFTKIPLLENLDYFRENAPLLKLYEETGKFFCYANKEGKLFYSAK